MNFEDPRLTAYALNELESAEDRAAVEAMLRDNPELAAELEETRAVAALLKRKLTAEEAAPLTAAQRKAVFAAASGGESVNGHAASAASRVVTGPWWRRHWVPSAIAASVVLSSGVALMLQKKEPRSVAVMKSSSSAPTAPAAPSTAPAPVELAESLPQLATAESAALAAEAAPADRALRLEVAKPTAPVAPASQGVPVEEKLKTSPQIASDGTLLRAEPLHTQERAEAPEAVGTPRRIRVINSEKGVAPVKELRDEVAQVGQAVKLAEGKEENVKLDQVNRFSLSPAAGLAAGDATRGGRPAVATAAAAANAPAPSFSRGGPVLGRDVRSRGRTEEEALSRGFGTTLAGLPPVQQPPLQYFEGEAPILREGRESFRFVPADQFGLNKARQQVERSNTNSYDDFRENSFLTVRENPLSTFSIDVDTASYSVVRSYLSNGQRPPRGAVRIEELVNYFPYSYTPPPADGDPFSVATEVASAPWNPTHRLVRVALKGREVAKEKLPAANLVFLVDVSGSMDRPNKLPLVKESLHQLVGELREQDSVGMVVYAGSSGVVLEPTSDKERIRVALDRLTPGGSTNGAAGIHAAYDMAQRAFKKEGTNRVILCTDGDFDVGTTSQSELVDLIQQKARTGVFLSVLGFGMGNLKDSTMEKLADKGNGNYAYIDSREEGRKTLVEQMAGTLFTIAKDVKIQVEFNPARVAGYRLIGYENRALAKEDFNNDRKDAGEIGAGHTVTALYEVVPAGQNVPAAGTVDPLKYQPQITLHSAVPPATDPQPTQAAKLPGSYETKRADFSGSYYLLENSPATGQTSAGGVPAAPAAPPAATDPAPAPTVPLVFSKPGTANPSNELLTVKLRFKQPDGDTSTLREVPLSDSGKTWEQSSADFRWAAAVAGFGMLLRDSEHRGNANWELITTLAQQSVGEDRGGHRAGFLSMISQARGVARPEPRTTELPFESSIPPELKKLLDLVLPSLEITDLPVLDALDLLTKTAREHHPEKKAPPIAFAGPSSAAQARVTLRVSNVPVRAAALEIARAAGLTITQENGALMLRPK